MYLINIAINKETVNSDNAEALLDAHRQWFSKYADKGNFLLLGPYKDIPFAGVIIAQAESREALDAMLKEDVYYPNKASYEIREFTANKIHPQIGKFIGQ